MKEGTILGNKTGRNEPCPCGSGKKFKRCCMNSDAQDIFRELQQITFSTKDSFSDFRLLKEKVMKLKPIMQKYNFDDLVRAVFCINIYLKNRSMIENMLALNKVLVDYQSAGEKRIKNYENFKDFFESIHDILIETVYDDYTIEDFGEVKLIWQGKQYKVIIGTGYEQTYGYYQFISETVRMNNNEDLFGMVLNYISNEIDFFFDVNKGDESYEIKFSIPHCELFNRTQEYFNNFQDLFYSKEITNYFSEISNDISYVHFIEYNNIVYPLFNTSMLIDFYSQELKTKSEEEISEIAELTIIRMLSKLTKLQDPKKPFVLYPVGLVDDKMYLSKVIHTFLFLTKDDVILAINGGTYTKEEINNEINLINRLQEKGNLRFAELLSNQGQTNEKIGVQIDKCQRIKIILYQSKIDPTTHCVLLKGKSRNYMDCFAVDIIYLLAFMDDTDEISRFYDNKMQLTSKTMSFGGITDYFFTWKNQDEMIEKGAIEYNMIALMPSSTDGYVYDYFKDKLSNFPFLDNSLFDNFHSWKIKPVEEGFFEYVNKINGNFGGYGRTYLNNCFLFYVHNVEFYIKEKNLDSVLRFISLMDDLNFRNARLHKEWFETNAFFNNKKIQVTLMPIDYAKGVDHSGFTKDQDRKYVYSDLLIDGNSILIRYAIKEKQLLIDLEQSKDRSVETTYYLELFKPLETFAYNEYQQLKEKIGREYHLPRGVGVASYVLEYKWAENSDGYHLQDKAFHLVRKEIAKLCNKIGIQNGEYKGKETNEIIRKIQSELISFFDKYIEKYDRLKLHNELLSIYSKILHNINVHRKRYNSFEDIEDFELIKVQDKIIQMREEERHNSRVVEFAIETNLNNESQREKTNYSIDDLEFVLAFSNWMIELSDTADICFRSEVDKHINIRSDFVIEIIESEDMLNKIDGMSKRIYENTDYSIKLDSVDMEFLETTMECFKKDSGIDFNKLLSVLSFMTLVYDDQFATEIFPNVYSFNKDVLISSFMNEYEGETNRDEIESVFDSLIIEPKKLKFWKGDYVGFLPINEREYRPNRFNLKPIVKIDNRYIFSPVVMSDLHNRWKFGITDFYLPVESDLKNTVDSILAWKKRYEDLIVDDVATVFQDFGVNSIWKEAELHKLDKSGSHPRELGDYDVIAYEESKNILWVIECKFLNKVGSIHENYMQQYNFFLKKKYDEKFKRRIDYIREHKIDFLKAQKIKVAEEIKIIPLMITNKIFFSRYKEIEFEIITLYEFKNHLNEIFSEI